MSRRLPALPREAYRADPRRLQLRLAQQSAARKNTAIIFRKLVLARCAQIRRECKAS